MDRVRDDRRRGLVAEHGISWILPRLVGPAHALDLLLSGRVVLAEEAQRLGLSGMALTDHDGLYGAVHFAEAAEKYETDIEIAYDDEEADAASAMLIMALGAEKGATVTVSGEDADAVAEIAALIEQDLDAE